MPKDFKGQDLRSRNFKKQDLRGADFSGADIRGAKFTDAKLAGAKFIGARAGVQKHWMPLQVFISFVLCSLLAFIGIFFAVVFTTFLLPPNFSQNIRFFPYIEMSVIQLGIYLIFVRQGFSAKALPRIATFVAVVLAGALALALMLTGAVAVAIGVVGAAAVAGTVAAAFAGALALALAPALALAGAVTSAGVFALAFALADALAFAFAPAFVRTDAIASAMAGASNSEDALAAALTDARVIAITIALAALFLSLYVAWRSIKEDEEFEPTHALGVWLGRLGGTSFESAALSDADFSDATLSNCDFSGATVTRTGFKDAKQLKRARLKNTILNDKAIRELLVTGQGKGQNYRGKNLQCANLVGAELCEADFTEADLSGAVLRDADLTGAKLIRTQALGANLARTDLCEADFTEADLSDADLHGTKLKNADLTRSRFVGCNLRDAVVENAKVTDIDIQRLSGLPQPPEQLRIQGNDGEILLIGSAAREFFNLPAIVEVYVTAELTQAELGCYHFHLGEIQYQEVATGVYLVGHRHEGGGSVLRFQAKSYDEIYQALPDLLAPFRMADAVDWKKTIEAMPANNRMEAITALAKMETSLPAGRWRFAEGMAEIFRGYRQARVYRISEGRGQGLRIDVFTNQQIADRLSRVALPEPGDRRVHIETGGGSPTIQLIEGNYGVSSSQQNFYGGQFQGCSFGDNNSLNNYFGVVDNLGTVEEDVKQKLKEAREAIETADLSNADKADVVDGLNKLTAELEKPEKDEGRVKRYWNRIKEVAPTITSILASAASLAKLLGVG